MTCYGVHNTKTNEPFYAAAVHSIRHGKSPSQIKEVALNGFSVDDYHVLGPLPKSFTRKDPPQRIKKLAVS